MPIIKSNYSPHYLFLNPHINTIIPNRLRNIQKLSYFRERIQTPDNDFLDIDFAFPNEQNSDSDKIVLLIHGLEGSSKSLYAKALCSYLNTNTIHAAVLNLRGCSGEQNLLPQSYHSGKTDDLETSIRFLISKKYKQIHLVGYSLGGNLLLKYLGDCGKYYSPEIVSAVAVSAPCHLESSSKKLSLLQNRIYLSQFLNQLKKKVIAKNKLMELPGISLQNVIRAKNFNDFDNAFTAPIHGFENAKHYYTSCSSIFNLNHISMPTLIVNALDDSFLSKECYPYNHAKSNNFIQLETPKKGGHVGFVNTLPLSNPQWLEKRIVQFILQFK